MTEGKCQIEACCRDCVIGPIFSRWGKSILEPRFKTRLLLLPVTHTTIDLDLFYIPKMPHSVSPPASPSVVQEDSILQDAPLNASSDVNTPSSSDGQNGNGAEEALKNNIKLEELFQDGDDDDDEFPSSSVTNGKIESSPPRGPL
jgi:hypothetical protein